MGVTWWLLHRLLGVPSGRRMMKQAQENIGMLFLSGMTLTPSSAWAVIRSLALAQRN